MRIGTDDGYLEIERIDPSASFSACRVSAGTSNSNGEFKCRHDTAVFDTSESSRAALKDFYELKSHTAEIPLAQDGWLRLARDAHGHIRARYRIGHLRLAAALEGEVLVEGEFADRFCRELRLLLWPDR